MKLKDYLLRDQLALGQKLVISINGVEEIIVIGNATANLDPGYVSPNPMGWDNSYLEATLISVTPALYGFVTKAEDL